jgi:small conductance mechanosensitive channel
MAVVLTILKILGIILLCIIGLILLLALIVLGSLGVEVTSLIALFSVVGLAVSLALQNTLSNAAGGLMLLVSKPFVLGEYVAVDGLEGTVESIGLFYSRLVTIDNKEIQIPNSQIAATKIVNYNRLGRRRVDLVFNADYSASTQQVKTAIRHAMDRFPQILSSPAPEIYLTEYASSSIAYTARMWVKSADYWTVYFGMLETVRDTFEANGVAMTFDHLNVHMVQD